MLLREVDAKKVVLLTRAGKTAKVSETKALKLYALALHHFFPNIVPKPRLVELKLSKFLIPCVDRDALKSSSPVAFPHEGKDFVVISVVRWLLKVLDRRDLDFLIDLPGLLPVEQQHNAVPVFLAAYLVLQQNGYYQAADRFLYATVRLDSPRRRDRLLLRQLRIAAGTLSMDPGTIVRDLANSLRVQVGSQYQVQELGGKSRGVRYVQRHTFFEPQPTNVRISFIEKCLDKHSEYSQAELAFYNSRVLLPEPTGWRTPKILSVIEDERYARVFLEDVAALPGCSLPSTDKYISLAKSIGAFAAQTINVDELSIGRQDIKCCLDIVAGFMSKLSLSATKLPDREQLVINYVERICRESLWICDTLSNVPSALSHGDLHFGNIMWVAGVPYFIDWGHFGRRPIGYDLAWCVWSSLPKSIDEPEKCYQAQCNLVSRFVGEMLKFGVSPWRPNENDMILDVLRVSAVAAICVSLQRRIAKRLLKFQSGDSLNWNPTELQRFNTLAIAAKWLAGQRNTP